LSSLCWSGSEGRPAARPPRWRGLGSGDCRLPFGAFRALPPEGCVTRLLQAASAVGSAIRRTRCAGCTAPAGWPHCPDRRCAAPASRPGPFPRAGHRSGLPSSVGPTGTLPLAPREEREGIPSPVRLSFTGHHEGGVGACARAVSTSGSGGVAVRRPCTTTVVLLPSSVLVPGTLGGLRCLPCGRRLGSPRTWVFPVGSEERRWT